MNKVYLIIGSPGSGKTWVCEQAPKTLTYVPHDDYTSESKFVKDLIKGAQTKDTVGEIPFGLSVIEASLEAAGVKVIPLFILEKESVISSRYFLREKKIIPPGHLTRQKTYATRAKEKGAFTGTSEEVLKQLTKLVEAENV